ncbi:MAG TPA: hypothetical protein VJM32_03460 [Candidatus Saccharimonadales bacterium]|nr:hypothetical protein [Candidatus Saccharimonadales bacterium]
MMLPAFPERLACSESAHCAINQDASCAERPATLQRLHPRFMAEEVCTQAMVRHIRARRNCQMQVAWGALELGLNLQDRPGDAEAFFDYAEDSFIELQERSDKALTTINAQLGVMFMPAYRARFAGEPLPRRALNAIHVGIADVLDTFDETYDPKRLDKYAGVKPELVTLALFARLRSFAWLAYPASPREENTNITDFNHDSYVIRDGIKVPIQVKRKSGSGYDPSVAVVRYHAIMQRVNAERQQRTTQEWGNKRKATKPLAPLGYDDFSRLIVREARGGWLTAHEDWLLELGSMAAVIEVMEKERVIRGLEPQGVRNSFLLAA